MSVQRRVATVTIWSVALASGLAVAERCGVLGARAAGSSDQRAEWIWLEGDWRRPRPVAFFAVADLTLDATPKEATLTVLGDEEYVASLNGWPVGSGRYRQGGPAGRHRVDALLRPGGNRLVVELRSAYGGGGLLAWLEVDGRLSLPSGEKWRLFRELAPGLFEGWRPLTEGEAPKVWGAPPIGRWHDVSLPAAASGPLLTPAGGRPIEAARGRSLVPLTDWQEEWAERAFSPALWSATLLEWRHEVQGQLEVRFLDGDGGEGMVFFAAAGEAPEPRRPADALVLRAPGQVRWRDAVSRRFQRVLIAAKGRPITAWVWPAAVDPTMGLPGLRPGVLGVTPPPLRSPVEDKLRREFEGFASLAVREPR